MNVYDAIMKAADHIERNPSLFNFYMTRVPTDCGTPGCALGWIGFFLGTRGAGNMGVARTLGLVTLRFYERLNVLDEPPRPNADWWANNASICAKCLRLYAEKYHAPEVKTPDWKAMLTRLAEQPLLEAA